jgi:signal recognition particle receptor subunit beta
MVLFNYATRELTAKIVYYGPGLCGKTTNLQYIHQNLPEDVKGKMLSLATKTDRTLFFDFLPIDLGEIRGMKTRVQLYTVPGQVFYNETRKLVLKGADGIVFVADSQEQMVQANVESFKNLEENLKAHGMTLAEMPHVIQFNKRDLPNLAGIEELNSAVNKFNAPFYESVATTGIGVQDTLKAIAKLVLLNLTRKYDPKATPRQDAAAAAPTPAKPAAAEAPAPTEAVPETPAAAASGPPAPPQFHGPSAVDDSVPEFGESEIDQLVDEVDEVELPTPEPVEMPMSAVTEDSHSVDLGSVDDDAFELSVPVETPEPEAQTVAISASEPGDLDAGVSMEAPADEPAAETGTGLEVDLDFDPEWQPGGTPAVEETEIPMAAAPIAPEGGEGLAGAGLELGTATEEPTRIPVETEIPVEEAEATAIDDAAVLLTEAASDDELFNDPSLEVARLASGEAREIVVPVMVGEGPEARRFKLSVVLRLDATD